jgi:hypothetical protein
VDVEPGIGLAYQPTIEAALTTTRLITATEDNCLSRWIKRKGKTPDTVNGLE